MEKKASTQKLRAFLKKNVYYIIMAACLLAIAAMITATVLLNNNQSVNNTPVDSGLDVVPTNGDPVDTNKDTDPTENPGAETKPGDSEPTSTEPDPTPAQSIVFDAPVATVDIGCDYSMDALVWNSTLRHYAVHNGIDFKGEDGTNVLCVYDGVVSSVGYDMLNGYTVTIRHNDTLYTSYGSLNEPTVKVGQNVRKGDVIGTMGNTAGKEYSMGPHLHFSVYENDRATDPYKYMTIAGK